MPRTSACRAASLDSRLGAKPPSSPTAVDWPASCRVFLSAWKTSSPTRRHSAKGGGRTPRRGGAGAGGEGGRAGGDDHELLEVDRVVGVRAAVDDVHHRHRQ